MFHVLRKRGRAWAGGGWTPEEIGGILGWWDTASITGKSDGDSINLLPDSINDNDMVQTDSNPLAQPYYRTNIVNGLAVLENKTNSYLETEDNVASPKTCVVVAYASEANFGGYRDLLHCVSFAWSNLLVGKNGTNDLYKDEAPVGATFYIDGVGGYENVTQAWHIFTITFADSKATKLRLGYGGYTKWVGYFSEVLAFDSEISGTNLTNLHSYLKTKYGIA